MTDYTDPYSGRTQFTLRLRITGSGGSVSWVLDALGGPSSSYVLDEFPYQVKIGPSYTRNGEHNLDFRSASSVRIGSGGPLNLSGTLAVSFKHGPAPIVFGTAQGSGTYVASSAPGAPGAVSVSAITPTSANFAWGAAAANGSAVTSYGLYISKDPTFATHVYAAYLGNVLSKTDPVELEPNTQYYVRNRAMNGVGTGPYNVAVAFKTLPASAPGITVLPSLSGSQASVTLTPPGGVSGVTSYVVQYRLQGTTAATTVTTTVPSTLVTDLTPGSIYEWRASAIIGSYQSPFSAWMTVSQPNPATSPGDYFDGTTPDKADTDYGWTGTVNNSLSTATALQPTGWITFAAAATTSGGTGAIMRATGGYVGQYAARAIFFSDATAARFTIGTASGDPGRTDVQDAATYVGSIFVALPGRSQRMAAIIVWFDGAGTFLSYDEGDAQVVGQGAWTRLIVQAEAPAGAEYAAVRAVDVTGAGWSLWLGGDVILADAAMITVGQQFPYFDGSLPDDANYTYDWLATANASPSRRDIRPAITVDPLADPDCDPLPQPPRPPAVLDECIDEVLVWRRYWAPIPASEVSDWLVEVPTLAITTGSGGDPAEPKGARQVRIRVYPNPFNWPLEQIDPESYCSEQIISYIPPYSTLTLDGPLQRVFVSVSGGNDLAGDHLLYGTGGIPATWPELSCGIQHVVSFDVPLEAPEGNIQTQVWLTRRT